MKIAIIVLAVVFTPGCGNSLQNEEWARAEAICKERGGVQEVTLFGPNSVRCSNGEYLNIQDNVPK